MPQSRPTYRVVAEGATRPFTVEAKRHLLFFSSPRRGGSRKAPVPLWQDHVDLDQRASFRRIAELGCRRVR